MDHPITTIPKLGPFAGLVAQFFFYASYVHSFLMINDNSTTELLGGQRSVDAMITKIRSKALHVSIYQPLQCNTSTWNKLPRVVTCPWKYSVNRTLFMANPQSSCQESLHLCHHQLPPPSVGGPFKTP